LFYILGLSGEAQLDRLNKLQNKGMRAILNAGRRERITNMCDTLGWMTVNKRINLDMATFVFRLDRGMLPPYLGKLLIKHRDTHKYSTRNKDNNVVRRVRGGRAAAGIFHKGVRLFNSLPEDVRKSPSVGVFRERAGQLLNM
jgi:hypothetical protein